MPVTNIEKILSTLNAAQLQAATCGADHTLVLAGAGCGKTSTITARAAFLVANGIDPRRIQILSFTKRSAQELVERIHDKIGDAATGLQASTFHTWCMSLMRSAPHIFGKEDYTIVDADDQVGLFKMCRSEVLEKNPTLDNDTDSRFPKSESLQGFFSFLVNTGKKFGDQIKVKFPSMSDKPEFVEGIRKCGELYVAKKEERKLFDYDDLLKLVAQQLELNPSAYNYVVNQYDHLLIDEFQDTNPLQWSLLDQIKDGLTLYAVGDDAQSIYAFRGADFKNIHSFTKRVEDSQVLKLEENYRCKQEILDFSNWILNRSPLGYNRNLKAVRGKGMKPHVHSFDNTNDEAEFVVGDLIARKKQGAQWSDHMVLVRSGFSGKLIEAIMLRSNVPYTFIGGSKLLESSHVRDVMALFRLSVNYKDDLAWMRYLQLFPKIGESAATKIAGDMRYSVNIESALENLRQTKMPSVGIDVIEQVRSAKTVKDAVFKAAKALDDTLFKNYEKDWDRRKKDFGLIMILAEKHDNMRDFIEEYVLNPVYQKDKAEDEDVVQVITVHSAKGAEAPVCYCINMSPATYPGPKDCTEEEIEESRRVAYVALTRAMDELIITRIGEYIDDSKEMFRNPKDLELGDDYFMNGMPRSLFVEIRHEPKPRGQNNWYSRTGNKQNFAAKPKASSSPLVKEKKPVEQRALATAFSEFL